MAARGAREGLWLEQIIYRKIVTIDHRLLLYNFFLNFYFFSYIALYKLRDVGDLCDISMY